MEDSLLNRSYSADAATSSVTLPSSIGNSSRNSSSVKRRIDLNTPVTNKNGRIEEAGELDDDDGRIEEGGEVDFASEAVPRCARNIRTFRAHLFGCRKYNNKEEEPIETGHFLCPCFPSTIMELYGEVQGSRDRRASYSG